MASWALSMDRITRSAPQPRVASESAVALSKREIPIIARFRRLTKIRVRSVFRRAPTATSI